MVNALASELRRTEDEVRAGNGVHALQQLRQGTAMLHPADGAAVATCN